MRSCIMAGRVCGLIARCKKEEIIMKNFFKDWNFKKHAKLVTGVYLVCYAIDMTLGYAVAKKCLGTSKKADEEE